MTKLQARYMYLFHWHCNYFHFLITAVARLYTCCYTQWTLTRRLRTVAAEARSSCITSSFLFAPTLRWWLPTYHDVTRSTCQHQFVFIYMNFSNTKKSDYSYNANKKARTMTPVQGEGGEGTLIQQSQGCAKAFSLTFKIWELRNSLGWILLFLRPFFGRRFLG